MPTVTQGYALDCRHKLEVLAGNLSPSTFKGKLAASTLDAGSIARYGSMWDWCNKYVHPQPDGKHPNQVATGKAHLASLKGVHKFKPK